jgi:uncharacterized protein (TIGR03000 family)
MYSVVMVMALAGSAEVQGCHIHCGCLGIRSGCHGGCYGGCYGGGYGGSSVGCYGGGYGGSSGGCYGGGYGGYSVGCYGGGYGGYSGGCYGGGMMYGSPGMIQQVPGGPEKLDTPKKEEQAKVPAPATIVVTLPANARLVIDGYTSNQTSDRRVLLTPPIPAGQEFTYSLVVHVNQDGQDVQQTQRVTVRPGQQVPVRFTFNTLPAAASR